MGVQVYWDETKSSSLRIIYVSYRTGWSWDDFYDAMNTVDRMVSESSSPVHFINDFTHSSTLPPSTLQHMSGFARTLGEVGGVHVLVKFGALWRSLQAVVQAEHPHMASRILSAETVEDAHQLLLRSV